MKNENVRKKEKSESSKKRFRIFIYIVISMLSIVAVFFLTTYLLTITKVINQGNFRINDFVITSKVDLTEDEEINIYGKEDSSKKENETDIENELENSKEFVLDVSQRNRFNILIPTNENITIKRAYLSDISILEADKNIVIKSGEKERKISDIGKEEFDLDITEKDNQYELVFNLINKNIIDNAKIPEGVKVVVYDGTIFNTLGFDISKLKYTFKAKLNIEDSLGKTSYCNISVELPKDGLGENGIVIERENLEEYTLKLKQKYLNF